jgi:hypothetical protein
MCTLLDFQRGIRDAMVSGITDAMAPQLAGGRDPRTRLAIHTRHFHASLTRTIVDRYPATVWLIGSELVVTAAQAFVRDYPPTRPCLAEYGDEFPAFLGRHPGAAHLRYLTQFAELEWHAGRLALATEDSPHVQYMHIDWPVDELLALYLAETAPDQFTMSPCDAWVEIRGLRGELFLTRVEEPLDV